VVSNYTPRNYTPRPLAQFDDETVNLVATREGRGEYLDTKDRSIGSDWVRAKSGTLRRLNRTKDSRLQANPHSNDAKANVATQIM
jgi:hypothetical protein